jgi:hypothetical protein
MLDSLKISDQVSWNQHIKAMWDSNSCCPKWRTHPSSWTPSAHWKSIKTIISRKSWSTWAAMAVVNISWCQPPRRSTIKHQKVVQRLCQSSHLLNLHQSFSPKQILEVEWSGSRDCMAIMSQLLKTTKFNIQERSRQGIAQRGVLLWRLKAKATVFRSQISQSLHSLVKGWASSLVLIKTQTWIIDCPKITLEVFQANTLMCRLLLLLSFKTWSIAITYKSPQIRCRISLEGIYKWSVQAVDSHMAGKVLSPCCNLPPKWFRKAFNLISNCKMLAMKCK